ncbi:MAG: sensor histidine kinase, partial [Caulobacter sp.]|nr:sensor histidine kinase [Caulobacter sp.]
MEPKTRPDPISRPASQAGFDPALAWRLGWLGAVCLASAAALFIVDARAWPVWGAMAAGAVPALASLMFARGGERTESLLLVLWAVGGASAAALTGGVSGAMAAWCLAPVAAASTMDRPKRLAEGAALALIGGCVAALVQLSGLAPAAPTGPLAFLLGFLALVTMGLGLAAGLLIGRRRQELREDRDALEIGWLETLLDGLPYLAVAVRGHEQVTTVRGSAPLGLSTEQLMTRGLAEAAAPADRPRLAAAIAQAHRDGAASLDFVPAQGLERVVTLDLQRVAPNQLVGVLRDVTAERDRAAALEQARADAEGLAAGRARFLANMSHELRTPLNAIIGYSELLSEEIAETSGDAHEEDLKRVVGAARHLLALIDDILDLSKIEAGM